MARMDYHAAVSRLRAWYNRAWAELSRKREPSRIMALQALEGALEGLALETLEREEVQELILTALEGAYPGPEEGREYAGAMLVFAHSLGIEWGEALTNELHARA